MASWMLSVSMPFQSAQPEFFILLASSTSSWRSAVPGPVVFYLLCSCSLILHAHTAKARISLRIHMVWSGSLLCALWKAGIIYLCGWWGLLSGCAVLVCCILVYCGNCTTDNLLYCALTLFLYIFFCVCNVAGVAHRITLHFRARHHLCLYCLLHPEEAEMAKHWC